MRRPALLMLAMGLLAGAAQAQNLPLAGMLPGSRQPGEEPSVVAPLTPGSAAEIGTWAEYRFQRGAEAPMRVRYSLVERSAEGDWLETQYMRSATDRLLVRVLIEGRLDRQEHAGRIKRVIVQQGSMQALELPTNRGAQALPPPMPRGGSAQPLGSETVTIAGKSIATQHLRAREGPSVTDAWVSAAVPLWGLVRFSSRRYRMDLLDFGTGARSALAGEPVRFDPAQLAH